MASEGDLLLLEDGGVEIEGREWAADRRGRGDHAGPDCGAAAMGPDLREETG